MCQFLSKFAKILLVMSDNFHELCILTICSSIAVIVRTTVVLRFFGEEGYFWHKMLLLTIPQWYFLFINKDFMGDFPHILS